MIKAPFLHEGKNGVERPGVFLGLSRPNTERLLQGRPIRINLADIARELPGSPQLPDVEIILVAGETEEAIIETLVGLGDIAAASVHRVPPAGGDPQGG